MNIHSLYTLRTALVAVALGGLCSQSLTAAPEQGGPDSRFKQNDSRNSQRGRDDNRNKDSHKQSPMVVKPAPVVVKPAPIVVKPAPVVVKPAPIVVKPAPVVVTISAEQGMADDYLKLLGELPRVSDDVAAGRMSLSEGVTKLMAAAQSLRAINNEIGRADQFGANLRALLSTVTYDSSIQNLRNASSLCNDELAKSGYFSSPTYQGAVAEYLSAMFNAG